MNLCYEMFSTPSYRREFERRAASVGVAVSYLISHPIRFVLDEDATRTADVCQ